MTAEGKLQELRDETQQAVDAFFSETIALERDLVRRHEAWVSAGHQAPSQPVFGDKDHALKDARAEGEEGEEAEPEAAPEEDAAKGPKFDPSEFKWTVTERRAKNLPQVFKDFKGINCNCELKKAETFST